MRKRVLNERPFKYQMIGPWKIHRFKGEALLGDEMGLGKTFQVLIYMRIFMDEGPFVVVCPKTAKYVWLREAFEKVGMRVEILDKRTPPENLNNILANPKNTIYVVNYEILGKLHGSQRTWCKFLRKLKPKLIVGDEAQYLINPRAQRTKNFKDLRRKIPKCILVTGTPMDDNPSDLWSLLNILKPRLFPGYMPFVKRYCKVKMTHWGPKVFGGQRLDELHEILKQEVLIRRTTAQVHKDLPPKRRVVIPIDLPDMKSYRAAEKDLIAWLRATKKDKSSTRKQERQSKMMYLKHMVGQLKVPVVKQWIDDFHKETGEKLVVFGYHRDVLKPLHQHYKKRSVIVDGSVTDKKRVHAIDTFLNADSCDLFFGNLKAASSAWSARGVTKSLTIELWWKPAVHNQAEKRTHGVGRGRKGEISTAYYLIAKGTIEEKLMAILQERQQIVDETLDGHIREDSFDGFDKLEEALLKGGI